jgi:hypothetical protein
MLRTLKFVIVLCVAAAHLAEAGDLPAKLTVGYDQEGEVDASPSACEAATKDLVEWSDAEMKEAIALVCKARQAHIAAYAALQKSYKRFAKVFGEDTRLDTAEAVDHFQHMIKACIDHKSGITTGGHNIATDIIPNDIAANCLDWGRHMLDDETAWYEQPSEQHTRAAP